MTLWRVLYDDGDEEDYTHDEVQKARTFYQTYCTKFDKHNENKRKYLSDGSDQEEEEEEYKDVQLQEENEDDDDDCDYRPTITSSKPRNKKTPASLDSTNNQSNNVSVSTKVSPPSPPPPPQPMQHLSKPKHPKTTNPASGGDGGGGGGAKHPAKEVWSGPPDEILHFGNGSWPVGWTKKKFERASGKYAGQTDRYWFTPQRKYKLRSMKEVYRFFEALEQTQNKNDEIEAWKIFKVNTKNNNNNNSNNNNNNKK
jgi:hypothetical protein